MLNVYHLYIYTILRNIYYLIISFPVTRWSKSLVHARLWFEIKQLKNCLGFNSDCNVLQLRKHYSYMDNVPFSTKDLSIDYSNT